MKTPFKIPFGENGQMRTYFDRFYTKELRDNIEWDDILQFSHFERGRSAAHALFVSRNTNLKYYMFLTDLSDAILEMHKGVLLGKFIFTKRGQNFGIKLSKEKKDA